MKALVFAAGIGSRLKPWTNEHPKALVEVDCKPMLQRVIENIIAAGITDIIVNVHHFGEQIIDFLQESRFDADISVSDERSLLLDTGGGLRKVVPMLNGEPVLIHNADILTDYCLTDFIAAHQRNINDATLLVASRNSSRRLVFNAGMRLQGWTNIATGAVKPEGLKVMSDSVLMSFNGIHIINPSLYNRILDYCPAEVPFSIIDFYLNNAATAKIGGELIPDACHWFDIGKPATLEDAKYYMASLH